MGIVTHVTCFIPGVAAARGWHYENPVCFGLPRCESDPAKVPNLATFVVPELRNHCESGHFRRVTFATCTGKKRSRKHPHEPIPWFNLARHTHVPYVYVQFSERGENKHEGHLFYRPKDYSWAIDGRNGNITRLDSTRG